MNEANSHLIIKEVLHELSKEQLGDYDIPIGVSARHCHLCKGDLEKLFGKGYELTQKSALLQPGQFAANETVTIVGPRGSIEKVRILGPLREETQIEVSQTDSIKLGLKPPIRQSGDIVGSAPITLVGPKGSIYLEEGLIIAQAHIHMSLEDAKKFAVKDGEYVTVDIDNGERSLSFTRVLIRTSAKYVLEMHIDTDEANAGSIQNGQKGRLRKEGKDRCSIFN